MTQFLIVYFPCTVQTCIFRPIISTLHNNRNKIEGLNGRTEALRKLLFRKTIPNFQFYFSSLILIFATKMLQSVEIPNFNYVSIPNGIVFKTDRKIITYSLQKTWMRSFVFIQINEIFFKFFYRTFSYVWCFEGDFKRRNNFEQPYHWWHPCRLSFI